MGSGCQRAAPGPSHTKRENAVEFLVSRPGVGSEARQLAFQPLLFTSWLQEHMHRSHYVVGESGWEEVADLALDWAEQNAKGTAST